MTVVVGGHRLRVTNLDKVLYPATGTTKADVLGYLTRIAPVMVPHCAGRPATRKRWPDGVGTESEPGPVFFVKNLEPSAPEWVARADIEHSAGPKTYPLVDDAATLAWLGQVAALEVHVPQWRFGSDGRPRNPDRLVLDLDPGPGAGLAECAEAARLARGLLLGMGLAPVPVTSGSKGIHLYAALAGDHTSDQVSAIAHELARALEADHGDLVVSDMKKSSRGGKVLVDWSQNNAAKTTVAPYSLRGRTHPTVAAPRTWDELDSSAPAHLEYHEVLDLVTRRGDPMAGLAPGHAEYTDPGERTPAARDRLEVYRGKRDPARTPEPVPAASPGARRADGGTEDAPMFVIQEHHAGRLHWDFRLEHDGVLVSWALPKGVPTDGGKNHLAVQTEDHPIEYGTFVGTIPQGEYGGGDVRIWDTGTYELRKWYEGKEVIAVLTGAEGGGLAGADGPGRQATFALIRTGGGTGNHWLIHLVAPHGGSAGSPRAVSRGAGTTRRSLLGRPPSPMLATPGTAEALSTGRSWALEMKWDGVRAIVAVNGGAVRLMSRNGNDVTALYPELGDLAAALVDVDQAVLDGEIVALDERGRPSFAHLQKRFNLTDDRRIARLAASAPVRLMLFDVLEVAGRSQLHATYDERRTLLHEVVDPAAHPLLDVPDVFDGDVDAAVAASRMLGLEGVVAKRRDSRYTPGRRSPAWVKIKHALTQEVVVVGWRPGQGNRSGAVGSLLAAVPDGARLRYVGRVGSGFSQREVEGLVAELARDERATPPLDDVPAVDARDARWVEPTRVGEVVYTESTPDGRLRHPRWRGWRPDKAPGEVLWEGTGPG
ncbi:ATP-dependent DNA ligase [Georgenia sp.]